MIQSDCSGCGNYDLDYRFSFLERDIIVRVI